ncbi:MAG TPA: EscU/YscU/HrcU family type III secretion system export apparatus switch protein [Bryobacteraceae bacterium]|nr:EscU/YscU/HrcU family type III secretion system export apparatus switch protein [Bryobacteraceae bacterium]
MADQRTEKPTQRRIDRARREGNFPSSREFVSAAQFLAFVALATGFSSVWFFGLVRLTRGLLREAVHAGAFHAEAIHTEAFGGDLTAEALVALVHRMVLPALVPLIAGGAALAAAAVGVQLVSTRFGLAPAKLIPDGKRLSVINKIKNLPAQNLPIFLQALVLLPVVALVVYYEISENFGRLLTLPWITAAGGVSMLGAVLKALLWRAAGVFLLVGLIDLWWQNARYTRQLRMSKQEIRDDLKEQQGNPQMKMRIRRIQRDMARRQMMKEIPTATAVIVNPTHFAVAIRYQLEAGGAPKVVAKGKNYLAQRIRQRAILSQVPIVENAPLAQALYKSVDVGQEIPANLYRAVAEILAYIYRLMGGRLPG